MDHDPHQFTAAPKLRRPDEGALADGGGTDCVSMGVASRRAATRERLRPRP